MEFLEILKSLPASEITVSIALIAFIIWFLKFVWKEFKSLKKDHEDTILKIQETHIQYTNRLHEEHKEESNRVIKEMFETVNKNTESNTKLAEAVRDLGHKIHYK